jgi:hypothetical protein
MRSFTTLAAALVLPLSALAATPRVAVLDVQNMTCAALLVQATTDAGYPSTARK